MQLIVPAPVILGQTVPAGGTINVNALTIDLNANTGLVVFQGPGPQTVTSNPPQSTLAISLTAQQISQLQAIANAILGTALNWPSAGTIAGA